MKYLSDFSLIAIDGGEIILVLINTKNFMKKYQLAEKSQFFEGYSKWPILAKVQRVRL